MRLVRALRCGDAAFASLRFHGHLSALSGKRLKRVYSSTNVAAILAAELDGFATTFRGLGYAELAHRIYSALERMSLERGVTVADGTLLDVELGAADLAALTRIPAQEVATAVFHLERDGWIRTNGSLITLLRR
jgi:hypothetical protein